MAAKRPLKQETPRESEAPTAAENTRALLDKLAVSETRYRRLFETAQDGILLLDAKTGEITDVNPFLVDLLGYSEKEIVGKKLWEIGPFLDRAAARNAFEKLQTDHYVRYEDLPLEASDGRRVQVEFVSNLYAVGSAEVIQCNIRDIAQRKLAEDTARGENLSKELALASDELGVWRLDLATGKVWRSLRYDQIFGYSTLLAEWTYEMFLRHVLPEDRGAVADSYGSALAAKTDWDFTCRIRREDGEVRWIWAKGKPELDERQSPVAMFGFVQDISEQKRAETDLLESEQRLTLALEATRDGIYDVDFAAGKTFYSQGYAAMLGYGLAEMLPPSQEIWEGLLHPDDREGALGTLDRCMRGEAEDYDMEFRLRTKTGEWCWIQSRGRVVGRNSAGNPLRLVGTHRDITERKQAEEALSRSFEATLNALSRAAERRDPYTAGHQRRVTQLALAISRSLGYPEDACHTLRVAGMLHDIGKLGVPAEILSKPSALSRIELELVRTHPQVAYEILGDVGFPGPVAEIVLQHHERLDGSGYPRGLSGAAILPEAKVLAIADVVEAMASHRPYRPALGIAAALDEIRAGRGTHYDPQAVDVCVGLFESGQFSLEPTPGG